MYTVLLADDEESVLNVLKKSINWQELGVDKLLTASDGMEAFEIFESNTVDLLVTDIRMPVMDGIELIRRVRQLQPETHCVLLTAYGEFEYAQEAIRLGVDNYLLKPVAKEEILQTIQSALDNVYKKRSSNESLLQENVLRRWVLGNISAEELGERAAVLGINLYQQTFCVVRIVNRRNNTIASFRAVCMRELQKWGQVYGFWDEKGHYVLIVCGKELNLEVLQNNLLKGVENEYREENISVAVGTVVTSYDMLHVSYQAAGDTLETSDFSASGAVVLMADAIGFDEELLSEELRLLFYEKNVSTRENGFLHLAGKICRNGRDEKKLSQLCRACVHVLAQDFPLHESVAEDIYKNAENILCSYPTEVGKAEVIEFMRKVQEIFENHISTYSPMVQHMILCIRDSVLKGEEISLKVFCGKNGVTPAYLGHMFKKETSIFFNDYLLRCRLDHSMILLRNPNNKIKDIAALVGFSSTSYFVKCFREYKGISPAKYRLAWGGRQGGK
jgi:araC family DNA-binding response regulator